MAITMQQIRQAVLNSPELRAAVEIGNDQLVADTVEIDVRSDAKLTRDCLRQVFGYVRSTQMIWQATTVANGVQAEQQYQMKLLIDLLLGDGIDLWDGDSNQMINFLVQHNVIEQTEVQQVMPLKFIKVKPTVEQVGLALAPWRPNGKISPIPENAEA